MATTDRPVTRALHVLVALTAALYLLLATVGLVAYIDARHQRSAVKKLAVQTAQALCTFRHDLEVRADLAGQFLHDHPDGIPSIPAATLRVSLHNQRATLKSLESLHCPPGGGR